MTPARISVAFVLLLSAVTAGAAEAPRPRTILMLLSGDGANPTGTMFVQGFREALPALSDRSKPPFVVYVEFLDLNRFGDVPGYREQARAWFLNKYAQRRVDVIVTMYDAATSFALDVRDSLWPDVPIVAAGVSPGRFDGDDRPRRLTGWLMPNATAGFARIIKRTFPATRKLVLVSGSSYADRAWLKMASGWFAVTAPHLEPIILAELPVSELLTRLKGLPQDSVVLFLSYLVDGDGRPIELNSLAKLISQTANRPIFAPADTAIGNGVLGAYCIPTNQMGSSTCAIAQRVLDGADVDALPFLPSPRFVPIFDERQMKRWEVRRSQLPQDAIILYGEPNLWADHPALISTTAATLVILFGLVVVLTIERRRRILAQLESHQRFVEMSAMNRRAALGELSASIAHEINQPLGAIMNNAEAARLMLERPDPPMDDIRAAVVAIRDDDRRASEIVRRIRALVARGEFEVTMVDLRELIVNTLAIVEGDVRLNGVHVVQHFRRISPVAVDRTHLQQVLMNIVINALDAMKDATDRVLVVRVYESANATGISVSDTGAGFSPDALRRAFEPFFTTKNGARGMGMGLAISRRIIEAHQGTITVSNNARGPGATVTILLPRIAEARAESASSAREPEMAPST